MNDLTDQQRWDRADAPYLALDNADALAHPLRFGRPDPPPPPPAMVPGPIPIAWHVDLAAGRPNREDAVYFVNGYTWEETTHREYFDTEAAALSFFAAAVEDLDRSPRPTMHYPNGGRAPFCRSVSLWELRRYASGRTGMYVKTLEYQEERHELTVHIDTMPDASTTPEPPQRPPLRARNAPPADAVQHRPHRCACDDPREPFCPQHDPVFGNGSTF